MILGADAKERKIAVDGWAATTSDDLLPFIRSYWGKGITKVISTDIGRDGMMQGPSFDLYAEIRQALPSVYLIASGGISCVGDIERLEAAGIPAVIFGKAFYEGRIRAEELLRFI
jgi:phosphoribosylformimino-5-aminoimidazole carboxamide ribotide isomerase